MTSLHQTTDEIRAAVSSTSTCTPATTTLLTALLLPPPTTKQATPNPGIPLNARNQKQPAVKGTAKIAAKPRTTKPKANEGLTNGDKENTQQEDQLSPRERSILATEVINATLKALSDAIKKPAPVVRRKDSSKDLLKASARKVLRRSNSASLTESSPQPRTLNRVTSTPNISARSQRSSSSASTISLGHRSTAECARVAFSCLRALAAKSKELELAPLPPLQLESGMSVLVGRLITLGLDDLAIKELRILKRRLDPEEALKKDASKGAGPTLPPKTLAELLDFGKGPWTGSKLALVITTQLQVLKLMISSTKLNDVSAILPILQPSHPSSPTKLLLLAAQNTKPDKIAHQLRSLSEILLSLAPSISAADDALALESRLSVTPQLSIQLQGLALRNRVLWWKISGHIGDEVKDLFDPLMRCLAAFSRRSQHDALETYHLSTTVFNELNTVLPGSNDIKTHGSVKVFSSIFRIFSSLALEANLIDQAISWTKKVQQNLDPKNDSDANHCSVAARLVALNLRKSSSTSDEEELLLGLLEGLEQPFKGEMSEIEDLLTEVSSVRRAAISLLTKGRTTGDELGDGMRDMCESLVFLCPRLSLRYLGTPPDLKAATKELLRYEQRRHFVTKSGMHAVDSALFLVKTLLGKGRLTWDLMDSKLQDCLLLVGRLDSETGDSGSHGTDSTPSYFVRISNLYFSQYLNMRRDTEGTKDTQSAKALKRSIDCVRSRSNCDKKDAQLSTKLERMAELYKNNGRYDELFKTLLTLRDECINNGALSTVARAAFSHSLSAAWSQSDETTLLARTVQSLVKVQFKCLKVDSQPLMYDGPWEVAERGVLLEHLIEILASQANKSEAFYVLQTNVFRACLTLYTRDEYPIRRLRVLIRLLSLDPTEQLGIIADISEELEFSAVGGTKDAEMHSYFAHFKSFVLTLVELQSEKPKMDIIEGQLAVWSSIQKRCDNSDALDQRIDDMPRLLVHLQMVANYMHMKGLHTTRVAILRLIVDLNEVHAAFSNPNDLVLAFVSLGTEWLRLGYSGKAGLALDKAEKYGHENGVAPDTLLHLHLSYAEYLLAIGNLNKSEEHLLRAQVLYAEDKNVVSKTRQPLTLFQRTLKNQLLSKVYLIYSMLARERGVPQTALINAKISVRLLRLAWTNIEQACKATLESSGSSCIEKLVEDVSQLNISKFEDTTDVDITKGQPATYGSNFWGLVVPLFQGLLHVSDLYAHHGMFQETLYYAQQARKLVSGTGSDIHLATASASLGSLCMRAGVLDKGAEYLMSAKQAYSPLIQSRETAHLAYRLGSMNSFLGDHDAASAACDEANTILKHITSTDFINGLTCLQEPTEALEAQISKLTISRAASAAPKRTATRPKSITVNRKPASRAKISIEPTISIDEECPQLSSLKGAVLRQKAQSLMGKRSYAEALDILEEAANHSTTQLDNIDQGLAKARQLLFQSMEQMSQDPVYGVLQESTISFPAIISQFRSAGERLSVVRTSPPRKTARGRREPIRAPSPAPNSFFDKLRQAQETLIEVHSIALLTAPVDLIHTTSALMNSVAILLSASGGQVAKPLAHPGFASCSIESVRTLALRRERKAVMAEPQIKVKSNSSWPTITFSDSRRVSLGVPQDMSRFQRDYIDIIPQSWTAISISLSDSRNELSITKLQSGQSPFVLRLPLGRNNSIDADEEVFGFDQGHRELMDIVQRANESAHNARAMHERGARAAWWEEREALDARLKDLLENIEKVWLGGFTGIYSQHARRADLLARFQKSFHNILDKHLPSRQKGSKRTGSPRITLDQRILELFIGLGDSSNGACDFSEQLTDLLYFVVDVLQFHGEFNAYAEIDFDSIVIDTVDALRGYHAAARSSGNEAEGRHTILILDKALHAFPWESLPCMDGLAVSRLSSLGCLRERILAQAENIPDGARQGQYISCDKGSYVLNPSGDLKSTHTTFQKPLQSLTSWNGIIKREPSEEEFRLGLESSELFLYFGHGSGAQYIRAREIRKLEKCAVTILMGCSSGLLTQAGEFEAYGTPVNYMQASAPALVAILWDVTDKDIDRYAKSMFEEWGLFKSQDEVETKGKGKAKKKGVESVKEKGLSLVEAVAKARGVCHLRYLTAAAVCVYGIPVYLK